jgi:hypothetical protein
MMSSPPFSVSFFVAVRIEQEQQGNREKDRAFFSVSFGLSCSWQSKLASVRSWK